MTIELITTGGTIDKIYQPTTGEIVFDKSFLPEMLARGNSLADIQINHLMAIDSLDMTETDRVMLLQHIQQSKAKQIIITHGTDTMPETATILMQENLDKTIVLTGAMIPYSINNSDALFNLGGAVLSVQLLPVGVYISINGKIFNAGNVQKNKTKGFFKTIK